jgi:glutamate N-acetyltransferase/amino-acid N-acetyltransferase
MKKAFNDVRVEVSVTMKNTNQQIGWPKGFRSSGISAGIKADGSLDMALIYSDVLATAAGVFTTNQVCAAPVKLCRAHLVEPHARAIVVNSGIANACTGVAGMEAATLMASQAASKLACLPEEVLVCSTGKIGPQLPTDKIELGLIALADSVAVDQVDLTARAMMTTDTRSKQVVRDIELGGVSVRLTGLAKGAGMIEPNMATMLAFITTDAAVEPGLLREMLMGAVDQSFNRITVDGDQSTNDTVLLLANGASGAVIETADSADYGTFVSALDEICFDLAMMIVRDGEGADRFVTVTVEGAQSAEEADVAARSVANSLLNKTAWAGTYPDWGRIMDAIGYAAARVDEERVNIFYGTTQAVEGGVQAATSMEEMVLAVSEVELLIRIELGLGTGRATVYTCNCTEAYVQINV